MHTPGPWEHNGLESEDPKFRYAHAVWTADGKTPICSTTFEIGKYHTGPDDVDDANARLIAAAPDLLAACKGMSEWMREHTRADETLGILTEAHAAIAAAEGHDG